MTENRDRTHNWKIRQAAANDLPHLLTIEEQNFPSDRLSRRQMRYHLRNPNALFIVAEKDKAPAAYMLVFFRRDAPARIYSIATLKAAQGQGIGQALMDYTLAAIKKRKNTAVILEVRKKDKKTIGFYKRFGFTITRTLPAYYEDGADGVKMIKHL